MLFNSNQTIVIKIGSALLTNEDGELRTGWLSNLIDDISSLLIDDIRVVIVSSGSVALGRKVVNRSRHKLKIEEKQAAAAVGQPLLITEYSNLFRRYGRNCGQVLITNPDTEDRRRYLNTKNTLDSLMDCNVIPIVNENDTIATDELRFGDNDRLSALVAQMVMADYLIILSDIDGLYTDDPNKNPSASFLSRVEEINDNIKSLAKDTGSRTGTGGMVTKLRAAEIAATSGCKTIITSGRHENPIKNLIEGGKHTLFDTKITPVNAKKNWIHNSLKCRGKIILDEGAYKAIKNDNSLLPVGIKAVQHKFSRGDIIFLCDPESRPFAKGITAYSSKNLKKIIGHHTEDIEKILGYEGREVVIHKDDMVILQGTS
jgi:glutamate 5-kinase